MTDDRGQGSLDKMLAGRSAIHGDYSPVANCMQSLVNTVDNTRFDAGKAHFPADISIALQMIMMKIARIAAGDHLHDDHWLDIQGYAELARKHCATIHGDYAAAAKCMQELINVVEDTRRDPAEAPCLADTRAAFKMVLMRVYRIAGGDDLQDDHWPDIQSYAEFAREHRGMINGDYGIVARCMQELVGTVEETRHDAGKAHFPADISVALTMIMMKVAHIAAGNHLHDEHWLDIQDHAELARKHTE